MMQESKDKRHVSRNMTQVSRDRTQMSRDMTQVSRDMRLMSRDVRQVSRDVRQVSRDVRQVSRDVRQVSRYMTQVSRDIKTDEQGNETGEQGHETSEQGHTTGDQPLATGPRGHATVEQGHATGEQGHATGEQYHATGEERPERRGMFSPFLYENCQFLRVFSFPLSPEEVTVGGGDGVENYECYQILVPVYFSFIWIFLRSSGPRSCRVVKLLTIVPHSQDPGNHYPKPIMYSSKPILFPWLFNMEKLLRGTLYFSL
jgi:pre-mRNA-processing factor 8